jgi:uncharacterized phage protein (TIGR01671 family)
MEDRFLFRGKWIGNGEWVQGVPSYGEDGKIEGIEVWDGEDITFYSVFPGTICQCTGLKDKNGKLIWENDIVKCVDENNDIEFTAIIEFGNPNGLYSWGYQLQHIKGDEPNLDILLWVDMEEAGATCKVIGNKFDNPELLEV